MVQSQIHTPDSSRYWIGDTYEARHAAGKEPENIDKEFLRLWFRERCVTRASRARAVLLEGVMSRCLGVSCVPCRSGDFLCCAHAAL